MATFQVLSTMLFALTVNVYESSNLTILCAIHGRFLLKANNDVMAAMNWKCLCLKTLTWNAQVNLTEPCFSFYSR